MRNTTLKNMPDAVYDRLGQRAAHNRRSLNQEMLHILADAVNSPLGAVSLTDELAPVRARYRGQPVDAELVAELRAEGRP